MKKDQILYDSDKAATYKTNIKGWVDRHGFFYGENESLARWSGCTHRKCKKCGNIHEKSWTCCEECKDKHTRERYEAFSSIVWDRKTPICMFDEDQFFSSEDELSDYCEDNKCTPDDLMLVICEPTYPSQVDTDYWYDELAEDGELPSNIQEALDALNIVISKSEPISWFPGKQRIRLDWRVQNAK